MLEELALPEERKASFPSRKGKQDLRSRGTPGELCKKWFLFQKDHALEAQCV